MAKEVICKGIRNTNTHTHTHKTVYINSNLLNRFKGKRTAQNQQNRTKSTKTMRRNLLREKREEKSSYFNSMSIFLYFVHRNALVLSLLLYNIHEERKIMN